MSTVSAEESKELLSQAKEFKFLYCFCSSATPLDKLFASWIEKMGRKNTLGIKKTYGFDFVIKGEYIAQFFYEEGFSEKVEKFYKKNKNIDKIDYRKLQEIATEKTKINVAIIRSKEITNQIRIDIMENMRLRKRIK